MLESFRLEECPRTCYYIPDFITKDEEENLIQNVNSVPKPKWTCLKNRRLQNWGGIPGAKGMVPEQIPEWLKGPCKKIFDLGFFKEKAPNHILINEYLPGQGIMPHSDGPLYFPTVSTISLGSHTFLDFYKPIEEDNHEFDSSLENRYAFSLLLEPRSLVVLQDEMYTVLMHGIKEIDRDLVEEKKIFNFKKLGNLYSESEFLSRKTRISLTIRHVPKVLKINLNSLLFKK
ncbi:alpha-ketoglutarate-dependent dioxygenase alkB -like protein [Brachionus plicatilis]|uniref:Alpha-ketoglutarate-dependent dioxygenase alkB-like protein n=1 Tax=Brachionus plicatilis TaxID=10195 RepID=A0A3M7Q8H2_BRAPC|nr:alpha-ketoglutarate-dependent dioxygenase alkB -like protein [Brachionus plicatilis]